MPLDVQVEARKLMMKHKGYGDRPSRKANVDRLLWRNFGQNSAPKDPKAYAKGHERIFGKTKPPLEPGQREGYVVRHYRPSIAYEIDMDEPHNRPDLQMIDEPGDFD